MTIQIRNADISRRGFMIGAAGFTFAVASRLPAGTAKAAGKDAALSPWVTIATVSSVEIVTHGLKTVSLPAASAAASGRRDATANVNPAAPTMKPRRLMSALRIWIVMVRPPSRRARWRERCADRSRSGRCWCSCVR